MRATVLVSAALVLIAAACGGQDGEPSPATSGLPPVPGTQRGAGVPTTGSPPATTPARPDAAATAPGKSSSVRDILTRSLNPTVADRARFHKIPHYQLTLDLDWDAFRYRGTQRLTFTNAEREPLTELYFLLYPNSPELQRGEARGLSVDNVRVDGEAATVSVQGPVMRVPLKVPLAPGSATVVEMAFEAAVYRLAKQPRDWMQLGLKQLVEMLAGDSSGGYGVFAVSDGLYSLGLWYPILASYDEHGWDLKLGGDRAATIGDVSYFDVANFEVEIGAPADAVLATTGVEVGRAGERQRFVAGAAREFTVQACKDYESATKTVEGVKVTSYFRRAHRVTGLKVLEQTARALSFFNERFGPYPYTELDVAEAPLTGGAAGVEFPGIVTISDVFYASDSSAQLDGVLQQVMDGALVKDTLEFVVAHEVAHQWWNAVVGSDSQRHPFVDEALANHSAVLYFEHAHGAEAAEQQREVQLRLPYQLARMMGGRDRPVDLPVDKFASVLEYAAVVYGKGALAFDELRKVVGDDAYFPALRRYYASFAFRTARPTNLVGAVVKAAKRPEVAQRTADRWLNETKGDEDVGQLDLAKLIGEAMPELGDGAGRFQLEDLKKLVDMAGKLLSSEGDVDLGQIFKQFGKTFADGDKHFRRFFDTIGDVIGDGDLLNPDKAPEILKKLGSLFDDEQAKALFDAAGLLFKALSGGDEPAPSKP